MQIIPQARVWLLVHSSSENQDRLIPWEQELHWKVTQNKTKLLSQKYGTIQNSREKVH